MNTNKEHRLPVARGSGETGASNPHKKRGPVLVFLDGNNTFMIQTVARSAGARVVLQQPGGTEEEALILTSQRDSETDSRQGP